MQITVYNRIEAKKKWIVIGIFMLVTLAQCMIINMFSSQRAEVSGAVSGSLVAWLIGLMERIFGSAGEIGFLTYLVRKIAHFYNFTVLGILLCMDKKLSRDGVKQAVLWCAAGLLMAVFDELHQSFVPGRSAEIKDVMIDFSGVMFGMCFLEILMGIILKNRGRI